MAEEGRELEPDELEVFSRVTEIDFFDFPLLPDVLDDDFPLEVLTERCFDLGSGDRSLSRPLFDVPFALFRECDDGGDREREREFERERECDDDCGERERERSRFLPRVRVVSSRSRSRPRRSESFFERSERALAGGGDGEGE